MIYHIQTASTETGTNAKYQMQRKHSQKSYGEFLAVLLMVFIRDQHIQSVQRQIQCIIIWYGLFINLLSLASRGIFSYFGTDVLAFQLTSHHTSNYRIYDHDREFKR